MATEVSKKEITEAAATEIGQRYLEWAKVQEGTEPTMRDSANDFLYYEFILTDPIGSALFDVDVASLGSYSGSADQTRKTVNWRAAIDGDPAAREAADKVEEKAQAAYERRYLKEIKALGLTPDDLLAFARRVTEAAEIIAVLVPDPSPLDDPKLDIFGPGGERLSVVELALGWIEAAEELAGELA